MNRHPDPVIGESVLSVLGLGGAAPDFSNFLVEGFPPAVRAVSKV